MTTDPMAAPSETERLTLHRLDIAADGESFARDVKAGLTAHPKILPPKYFYDALGSYLFEAICLLPEYYPTRAESEILHRHADEIVGGLPGPVRLLELGSGSSIKTRYLIEAVLRRQKRLCYLPLDISPSALERSAKELLQTYPGLSVVAFAADYHHALESVVEEAREAGEHTLALFLGSTIGNLEPRESRILLREIRAAAGEGGGLLLGADLKKPTEVLLSAYDDPLGVTAAFNLNMLGRINRELGGRFDLRRFQHRAVYNAQAGRVEMHLVSRQAQSVRIEDLGLEVAFTAGETIHTESSHKFDREQIAALAADTGFRLAGTWYDQERLFSLNLLLAVG